MSTTVGTVDGLLAGRFRLTDRLTAGGTGQVWWRAVDVLLDRPVAVKTLRADRAWLVVELVGGEPLSDVLRRAERVDVAHALQVVAQDSAARQAAHAAGLVHRGVEPGPLGVVAYECLAGVRLLVRTEPVSTDRPGPAQQLVLAGVGKGATLLLPPLASRPDEARPDVGRNRGVAARATSLRGQRQAVRATAVLLALLAVGLGLTGTWDAAATVPSLPPGTPEAQASAVVVDAGLEPTTELARSSSVPRGGLLSVRPAAGTELERGDEVVLVVSSGPTVRLQPDDVVVPGNGADGGSPSPGEDNGEPRGRSR